MIKESIKEKRVAIVGLGGVGGYLGAMLAAELPHVTVVARGARYDAITKNGIVLHSELNGEICAVPEAVVRSAGELGGLDYILICVKNYSLDAALAEMAPAIGKDTILVPVMNGVECGDKVRAAFPGNRVIDSVIYIVSMTETDYSISQQGEFAAMRIGARRMTSGGGPAGTGERVTSGGGPAGTGERAAAGGAPAGTGERPATGGGPAGTGERPATGGGPAGTDERATTAEAVAEFSEILTACGIQHKISQDVELDIWRKYILNCAYNVATAAWDCPIGGLRAAPEKAADYAELVREAYAVGVAKGVALMPEHCDLILDKFAEYAADASSSLQRDMHEGKRAEIDTFSGYIVSEGKRLGVAVPVSERYEKMLRARNAGTRA